MNTKTGNTLGLVSLLLVAGCTLDQFSADQSTEETQESGKIIRVDNEGLAVATFAGGCLVYRIRFREITRSK